MKEQNLYKATDILWDVDEEDSNANLPSDIFLPDTLDIDDEDAVSDYLTEQTGFCHRGFHIMPVTPGMAFHCPYCGGTEFYAHQLVRMDVMVDGNNNWLRNVPDDSLSIYYAEDPYGPYECVRCGHEFGELKEETK